jgi:hypothetical protein
LLCVAGVITQNNGRALVPEAYLYGRKLMAGWETFSELQQAKPAGASNPCHPEPRLPPLTIGQLVDCGGLTWSGQGNLCSSALAVPLVAIVRRRVRPGKKADATKLPQWRRYAVVQLEGGPNPSPSPSPSPSKGPALALALALTLTLTTDPNPDPDPHPNPDPDPI